jgi:hypothetical protein
MNRFLEALHEGLSVGRIVSVADAVLICLGLTGTVAALAPLLLRVVARPRRPATSAARPEDR